MYVVLNYRRTMNQQNESASPLVSMFFPIMVLWTLCLAYFFGFFGISFLDTEEIRESPSLFGLSELQRQANSIKDAEDEKALMKPTKTIVAPKVVHTSRNDTTLCTDKVLPIEISAKDTEQIDVDEISFDLLNDDEVFGYLASGSLKDYQLEKRLGDYERAVVLRRRLYEHLLDKKLDLIPYAGYDYNKVCLIKDTVLLNDRTSNKLTI